MKKFCAILLVAMSLTACKEDVTGVFSGSWEYERSPQDGITTITSKSDHYNVHVVDKQMATDQEFPAVEVDGKFLKDEKSGKIYFTLIDATHMQTQGGAVYKKLP